MRNVDTWTLGKQTQADYIADRISFVDDVLDRLTTEIQMLDSAIGTATHWMVESVHGAEEVPHRYAEDARRSVKRIQRELRDLERIQTCWTAEVEALRH